MHRYLGTFCLVAALPGIAAAGAPAKNPDACSLLSPAEIEKVQGETVQQAKATEVKGSVVSMSECLYSLPTFSKSISLVLTRPDPANSSRLAARELWQRQFHGDAAVNEENEDEDAVKPSSVAGLGDEAFWIQSFVGTLYVLKGNAFLRISIGGRQDDASRLDRAKALAGAALLRMR